MTGKATQIQRSGFYIYIRAKNNEKLNTSFNNFGFS